MGDSEVTDQGQGSPLQLPGENSPQKYRCRGLRWLTSPTGCDIPPLQWSQRIFPDKDVSSSLNPKPRHQILFAWFINHIHFTGVASGHGKSHPGLAE